MLLPNYQRQSSHCEITPCSWGSLDALLRANRAAAAVEQSTLAQSQEHCVTREVPWPGAQMRSTTLMAGLLSHFLSLLSREAPACNSTAAAPFYGGL